MEKNKAGGGRSSIVYVLGYPLQEQIEVGHLDILMEMYNNALKIFDEVHIVSPRDDRTYDLGRGIHVHSFKKWLPRPLQLYVDGLRVSRLSRKENAKVVRALAAGSGFVAYLSKKLTGIPYVLSVHGDRKLLYKEEGIKRNFLISALEDRVLKIALRNADVVPVISEYIRGYAIESGARPERIVVHQNFVDTDIFKPMPKKGKTKRLVFVGRLEKVKGADIILRAMPRILRERSDVELLIVGEGPQKESLTQLAGELGVEGHVRFLGGLKHETELPTVLATSDIFVAPLTAGFTLIEAMACGIPVVAADIEWSREIVTKERGILVKAKDEEGIANAVEKLLSDPALCERMGKAARSFVLREFSLDSWKGRELDIYRRTIR